MSWFSDAFSYDALLECTSVLRSRAYGRILWDLVRLVDEHIVEPQAQRMLRYLVRTGRLHRAGRGPDALYLLPDRRDDIARLKIKKCDEPWDGLWHVFSYDIPTTHNTERHRLVRGVREMGFAPLGRSSWICARDWAEPIDQMLREWSCDGRFHSFSASSVAVLGGGKALSPRDLWELEAIRRRYEQMARMLDGMPKGKAEVDRRARARGLLAARAKLRALEQSDPMLPRQLLSKNWPRSRALQALDRLGRSVRKDLGIGKSPARGNSRE